MTAGPGPRRGGRALTFLLLAAGLALLAWQIDQRWDDIRRGFAAVGWWFAVIFALSLARFALRSRAWLVLLGRPVPITTATAATVVGDAVGNVTPFGLLASEPAKALYLSRATPLQPALAALVAENFFYSVSVAIYVVIAAGAMLAFFTLPPPVHLAGVVSLGGMAAVLAGAAWVAWQQPAVLSAVLTRVPIARVRRAVDELRTFETETYGAAGHQGGRLIAVAACETAFHVLSLAECWLTVWLLTGGRSLLPALVFDGLNRVVSVIGRPVPMQIGLQETLSGLLASAIGLPAGIGVTLALVRRVRVTAWAAVGLAVYGRRSA